MSKYTTELRFICETEAGKTESVGLSKVDEVISAALPHIFDFDFPIFDENYRTTLETKIIRHYYTREIGLETYGLWKLKLQTKLNEIMPYYNKLYQSELYTYNPLYDVDMTTTHVGRKTGENTNIDSRTSERSNSGTSKNVEDETNTLHDKSKITGNKDIKTDGTEAGTNKAVTSGNRDVENKGSETNTGRTKSSATRDYQRDDAYSDTPQGTLNNVRNLNYLTNARNIVDTEMTNENGDTTGATASENKQTENNQQTVDGSNSSVSSSKQNETNQQTTENDKTGLVQRNNERTDNFNETDKNHGTNIGSSKSTEDYVLHVMGKSAGANYARMIKDFRDNLLNIDMDIIRDLNELFMLVW